jgi:hypothetical protein
MCSLRCDPNGYIRAIALLAAITLLQQSVLAQQEQPISKAALAAERKKMTALMMKAGEKELVQEFESQTSGWKHATIIKIVKKSHVPRFRKHVAAYVAAAEPDVVHGYVQPIKIVDGEPHPNEVQMDVILEIHLTALKVIKEVPSDELPVPDKD